MATYRSIADSETDPKAPVTSELMKALALNPIAIMEGQSGAPRLAEKIQAANGPNESWATVGNLGSGNGVYVDFYAYCQTVQDPGTEFGYVQFEISTDGATFTNTTTLVTTGASVQQIGVNGSFFLDFASGVWLVAYSQISGTASSAGATSGTISGGPLDIQSIRFRALGYQTVSDIGIIARLQGGFSAS